MKKKHVLFFSAFLLLMFAQSTNIYAQKKGKSIKWTTMDNLSSKKMTMVFIYKKDCRWCSRMEAMTFSDAAIIKYNNKKFNCVKLEATADASEISRLGIALEGYPTTVFLNKEEELIQAIPGYIVAKDFEDITKYFGEEAYKEKTWEEYQPQYDVGKISKKRRN